jgi:transposase-like protein
MAKADHLQNEQEHHRLAFEQYYALGPKRSYQQVAQKLGVSASTVKLWSRTFGWRQRIGERDGDVARQVADRSAQAVLDDRERDLKIVRMAKMKLTKDIAEGKVKGKIPDLEMLIRLEDYLSGSQKDPLAWIDRETDPEKLRARLREITAAVESPAENRKRGDPLDG